MTMPAVPTAKQADCVLHVTMLKSSGAGSVPCVQVRPPSIERKRRLREPTAIQTAFELHAIDLMIGTFGVRAAETVHVRPPSSVKAVCAFPPTAAQRDTLIQET